MKEPMTSLGDWLACGDCFHLVNIGDRAGLLDRSMARFRNLHSDLARFAPLPMLHASLARMLDQFWDSKR